MSIATKLQASLNDAGVFWPTTTLLDAVNEAQLQVYCETKWKRTAVSLYLNTLDDLVDLPPAVVIPQWIADGTNRYLPTTHRQLEHYSRFWRAEQPAKPEWFVLWDATHLRVWPRPDQQYTYTLWGVGYPTEITSLAGDLDGPQTYQCAVLNQSLALLLEATRPDLADMYQKISEEHTDKLKKILRNQQSHNIRRLRPGTRFDLQQGGAIRTHPSFYPIEC